MVYESLHSRNTPLASVTNPDLTLLRHEGARRRKCADGSTLRFHPSTAHHPRKVMRLGLCSEVKTQSTILTSAEESCRYERKSLVLEH